MTTFEQVYSETGTNARMTLGNASLAGELVINSHGDDGQGRTIAWGAFFYDGDTGVLTIGDMQMGLPGKMILGSLGDGEGQIVLDASNARATLGGNGNGTVKLKNRFDKQTVSIEGEHGKLLLGGEDEDGDVSVKNGANQVVATIGGQNAQLTLGGNGANGTAIVKAAGGEETVRLESAGNVVLGGGGQDGDITIKNASGDVTFSVNGGGADIRVGGPGANGDVIVKNNSDIETIKMTGADGDITFLNADVAEDFEVDDSVVSEALPGTVMTVGEDGRLAPSEGAYDPRVVGVLAGAGDYRPGIVLDRNGGEHRRPLTMVGKAFCRVEAESGPIAVGDMLTTSELRGHAMRATDRERAFGAVIGKALAPCRGAAGLIPVLVALQ
ncbi:MAG: DUF4097 domain-containing protein [Actinomycetota bacterium]|nr:DUF4097 domain-containing protein [Actinomycetota bacterium]